MAGSGICKGCGADLGRPGGITVTETVTRFYPASLDDGRGVVVCDMAAAGMPESASFSPEFRCSLCGDEPEVGACGLEGWHV